MYSCGSASSLTTDLDHFVFADAGGDRTQPCRIAYNDHYSPSSTSTPYTVSAYLYSAKDVGHLGLMYNYVDELNFDYVFFRLVDFLSICLSVTCQLCLS